MNGRTRLNPGGSSLSRPKAGLRGSPPLLSGMRFLWLLLFALLAGPVSAQQGFGALSITSLTQSPPNNVGTGTQVSYTIAVAGSDGGGAPFITFFSQGQNISSQFSSQDCLAVGFNGTTEFDCPFVQSGASTDFVFGWTPPLGTSTVTVDMTCLNEAPCPGDSAVVTTIVEDQTGLQIVSGNGQSGPVGATLAPFVVQFLGPDGQPEQEVNVSWSVSPEGAGTLESGSSLTGGDGKTSNSLTIGQTGAITVTAAASFNQQPFQVQFSVNGGLADASGLNDDQRSVAEALDNACAKIRENGPSTPGEQDLLDTCDALRGSDSLGSDLDALLPDENVVQTESSLGSRATQNRNLLKRMRNLRQGRAGFDLSGLNLKGWGLALSGAQIDRLLSLGGGGASAEQDGPWGRWGVFVNGEITFGDVDATDNTPKFDFDTQGLTAGVDYRFTDELVLGAAFGYGHSDSDVKHSASNTDLDSYSLSLYGTYFRGENLYVEGLASYGWDDYDTQRQVSFSNVKQNAKAKPDGNQYSFSLGGGYDFHRGGFNFGPYGRVEVIHVDIDSYRERASNPGAPGAGSLLAVDDQDVTSVTSVLGGQLTYAVSTRYGVFLPQLRFDWEHEYKDTNDNINARFLNDPTNTSFAVDPESIDQDWFNLGIGVTATLAEGKSAFVYYERMVGNSDVTRNLISAGFRMEF